MKELPHFEKLNSENKNIKVVLVILDFKNQFESKLLPFLKKKSINSEVVLLTDKDYNTWLPILGKDWSGSIPATLIIKNGKRVFVERIFSGYEEPHLVLVCDECLLTFVTKQSVYNAVLQDISPQRFEIYIAKTPTDARLRRVPTYFCKLNKAFTTRFFKILL